ncbi:hypothetical protein TNCV_4030641 [Trichonephila clavipes]|nr:hypothetical protein TNCV_4030641 [Trichonephila clavipes]
MQIGANETKLNLRVLKNRTQDISYQKLRSVVKGFADLPKCLIWPKIRPLDRMWVNGSIATTIARSNFIAFFFLWNYFKDLVHRDAVTTETDFVARLHSGGN